MEPQLCAAVKADLGRREALTQIYELQLAINDIQHTVDHLGEWMKDQYTDVPLFIGPAKQKITPEPLGVVLIMGSWNFPIFTTILPLIPVIAAGNTCVVKPSELSPHSSRAIKQLFARYLDGPSYVCIEGGVQVAIELTSKPFDYIVFTGGSEKGKLVAAAAAKNLVPCMLELGGKSPCIVDTSANLDYAA
mmetsp:Transcript_38457/g.28296  ORF Transcript_38457/g.28296 Transcript_38457/m.28296 type:complete len:191 (+) Transcript_38457:145-717(+)